MAYENTRGNLGQAPGELPSTPSRVEFILTCPRCNQPQELCRCHDFDNQNQREP